MTQSMERASTKLCAVSSLHDDGSGACGGVRACGWARTTWGDGDGNILGERGGDAGEINRDAERDTDVCSSAAAARRASRTRATETHRLRASIQIASCVVTSQTLGLPQLFASLRNQKATNFSARSPGDAADPDEREWTHHENNAGTTQGDTKERAEDSFKSADGVSALSHSTRISVGAVSVNAETATQVGSRAEQRRALCQRKRSGGHGPVAMARRGGGNIESTLLWRAETTRGVDVWP